MNKVKKALWVVLLDLVLTGLVIFSVYMMLNTEVGSVRYNIFMVLIVISIPIIFFTTYLSVAGDKYDYNQAEFKDELSGEDINSEKRIDIDCGEDLPKSKDEEEE